MQDDTRARGATSVGGADQQQGGHGGAIAGGVAVAAAAAAGLAARKVLGRDEGGPGRWRVVTIAVPQEQVLVDDALPAPLAALGAALDVRLQQAPGDRGTELWVRLRDGEPSGVAGAAARLSGDDPRQDVRRALRETKSLLETGEVLQADWPPTTEATATNRALQWVTDHGRDEGRL